MVTCDNDKGKEDSKQNHQNDEKDQHVHGEKSQTEVMLSDFFHIIHYCGILLNKAGPEDDDCTPFDEFNKYAKTEYVAETEGGP